VDNTPGDKLGVWRDMRLADKLVFILLLYYYYYYYYYYYCHSIITYHYSENLLQFPLSVFGVKQQTLAANIHSTHKHTHAPNSWLLAVSEMATELIRKLPQIFHPCKLMLAM